jgi:hypothetical protein
MEVITSVHGYEQDKAHCFFNQDSFHQQMHPFIKHIKC